MIKYSLKGLLVVLLFLFSVLETNAQCTAQNVQQSVTNGDFESGYIASGPGSFTSSQVWLYDPSNSAMSTIVDNIKATGTSGSCAWTSTGHFSVDSYYGPFTCSGTPYNGNPFISEGTGRYDHTQGIGGTGKYLMIDGQGGVSPDPLGWKLWEQTLTIYPNQMYYFSAWFINLTALSTGVDRADIRFIVQPYSDAGATVAIGGPVQLGAGTFSPAEASRGNSWEQYYQTYSTPATAVTLKLSIYNQTTAVPGNDIAIDDISFINGCSSVLALNIPTAPNLGASQNICETNGTIQLDAQVPTGSSREYSWYSGTGSTQTQIGSMSTAAGADKLNISAAGTYRVCVYQAGGCAKSSTVTITASAAAGGSDINYCSTNQLVATVTPAALDSRLTYSWTKNAAVWAGSANSKTVTANGVGTYVINGTHVSGIAACNLSKSFNVTTSSTTISGSDINFCSDNQLAATVADAVMDAAYTYSWTKNAAVWAGSVNSKTATVDGVGTYVITGTHSNGIAACNSNKTFSVTASTASFTSSIGPGPYTLCTPASQTLTSSLTGAGYTYQWKNLGVNIPGATGSSYVAAAAGTYTVDINFNKAGCAVVTANNVTVTSTNPITPVNGTFCPIASGGTGLTTLSVTPALAGTTVYRWYDTNGTSELLAPSGTSSSFPVGPLSASKTYYVEDSRSNAMTLFPTATGTQAGNNPIQVSFDVTSPVVLNSVKIQKGAWTGYSNIRVALCNSSGTVLATSNSMTQADGNAPHPFSTATFGSGFSIPVGSGYYLTIINSGGTPTNPPTMNLFTSTTTAGSGVSNLTALGSPARQIFTEWSIGSSSNPCGKVPVQALLNCPLPVDFIAFDGTSTDNGNLLTWLVANEVNVNRYEVQRSIDGKNFAAIGSVNVGNGGISRNYSFVDESINASTNYYKIKEIDENGMASYSTVIVVSNDGNKLLFVSKNPFDQSTEVYFVTSTAEVVNLRVTDSKGSLIGQYSAKGGEALTLGEGWVPGLYLLQAWDNNTSKTYKVIKK